MNKDPEILFSPSFWSKRLGKDVIVEEHFRVTAEESRRVKATIPRTVRYLTNFLLRYTQNDKSNKQMALL